MGPKRKSGSQGGSEKKRKAITMETKVDIIKRSEKGETATNIGNLLGLSRSTVATIIKDKERIMDHVKGSAPMHSTVITKQRSGLLIEMEKLLILWLEDQNQRRIPISLMVIQEKARLLYQTLKEQRGDELADEEETFTASKGWFHRFKSRANLTNIKLSGEAASADAESAATYPAKLAKIIEEGGYKPEQVFNVDETGLFWKRMPSRTYISRAEKVAPGHKAEKARLTLLLGGNASGDFKIKPLLVHQFMNPRALAGIPKSSLPVHWTANSRAWVTLNIFESWYNDHFVPEVQRYLASKGLPFKALLLLDNAPGHPNHLDDFNEHIKVEYLPANTTSLLQPMDQGVIASFKAYYLRRTFAQALRACERDEAMTLTNFWKGYNVKDALKNISDAWDEVTQQNMNGVWGKLCPQFINDFQGFDESLDDVRRNIVRLGNHVRLNLELEETDVTEVLASHGEELSPDDLLELERQIIESEESNQPDPEPRRFTAKQLSEAFTKLEDVMSIFEGMDPNVERFMRVNRTVMDALRCYKEIWEEKKKQQSQTSITSWFTVSTPATGEVTVPEEEVTVPEEEVIVNEELTVPEEEEPLPDLSTSASSKPSTSASSKPITTFFLKTPKSSEPMTAFDIQEAKFEAYLKKKGFLQPAEENPDEPSSPAGSPPASPTSSM